MRFFLDEGVPVAVGRSIEAEGYEVIRFHDAALPGSPDTVVADIALANAAVLVAVDRDMKQVARGLGVGKARYRTLGLLAFRCRETEAIHRIAAAMPYIRVQLQLTEPKAGRRLFIEVYSNSIKIYDP